MLYNKLPCSHRCFWVESFRKLQLVLKGLKLIKFAFPLFQMRQSKYLLGRMNWSQWLWSSILKNSPESKVMPRGNKIAHSSYTTFLGDGKSYHDINFEIYWACIGMASLIAILIILALCYIAYEKYQRYRELQYHV